MSDEQEQTAVLVEDIAGDLGFRVQWSYNTHVATVLVYEIAARGMNAGRSALFPLKDARSSDQLTVEESAAEVYLEAMMKWDGCCDIDHGSHHYCDEQGIIKHAFLLRYLWQRAHQLLKASDVSQVRKH